MIVEFYTEFFVSNSLITPMGRHDYECQVAIVELIHNLRQLFIWRVKYSEIVKVNFFLNTYYIMDGLKYLGNERRNMFFFCIKS